MRFVAPAVAVTLFALSAPAYAGLNAPDGSCMLFCNSAPAATPSAVPDPTPSPKSAAPLALHHHRAAPIADASPEPKHLWKKVHPGKAAAVRRHQDAEAATAPRVAPTPPVAPAQRVIAAPAPSVAAAPPIARVTPVPTPAPSATASADTGAADAQRLLAHALVERAQTAPQAVASPAPSAQPVEPAPAPSTVAARNLGLVQLTADGVVVPWWPGNFMGRFAIWLAATALIAGSGFGLSKTGGRRLAA